MPRRVDAATAAQIVSDLQGRAMSYAESEIERIEVVCMTEAVHTDERSMEAIVTSDMEVITKAIADAFVMGYAASVDDEARPSVARQNYAQRAIEAVRRRARVRTRRGGSRG